MAKDVIARLRTDVSGWDGGLNQAKRSLDNFKSQCLSLNNVMGGVSKSLAGMATSFMGPAAAVGALTSAIASNIRTAEQFEHSMSELSSLTGLTGSALDDLKKKAIDLGGSTTQSASQVVDSFKLIGSQMPELLKNAEALNTVTKAAITLGEAAGIDVTQASRALTASLNIMGAGASSASQYINVLAAGSKEGAVDIQGLTDIIFKSGQAASLNKLSFEEFIAVAETVGPKFGSAAEAGTALNAMLLKLETSTNDKFKPSVVGLSDALQNIKDANLSAADATKLVTETGYKALVPLLDQIKALEELKDRITDTNTAEDQAKTNTDNLRGSWSQLGSSWEKFNLTINSGNGFLRGAVDLLTGIVNIATDVVSGVDAMKDSFCDFWADLEQSTKDALPFLTDALEALDTVGQFVGLGSSGGGSSEEVEIDGYTGAASVTNKPGSKITKPVENTFNDNTDKGIRDHIKALKEQRDEVARNSAEYKKLSQEISTLEAKISTKSSKTPKYDVTGLKVNEKTGLNYGHQWNYMGAENVAARQNALANKQLEESLSLDPGTMKHIQEQWNSLIKGIELTPLKVDISDSTMQAKKMEQSWGVAASAISKVGGAMSSLNEPALNIATMLAETIATLGLTYAQTLAKDKTSTSNIWAFIAAAAASTISLAATVASYKKSMNSYADGGVIKGGAYTGDAVPIMANAGEIVLNASMASNLASNLQSNIGGGGGRSYISGEQIVTVVNSYGRRTGRGEILR